MLGDARAPTTPSSRRRSAELMSEANGMPGKTSARYPALDRASSASTSPRPSTGSLVSLFAEAPADAETKPVGQIPHWLFATGDTLAINAFRALGAARQSHPRQRELGEADGLDASGADSPTSRRCLEEAMRLWPTTTMLSRETLADTEWGGRDGPGRHPGADPQHVPPPRPRPPPLGRPLRARALDRRRGGRATGRSTTSAAARRAARASALALLLGKAVLATSCSAARGRARLALARPGQAAAPHARLLRAPLPGLGPMSSRPPAGL